MKQIYAMCQTDFTECNHPKLFKAFLENMLRQIETFYGFAPTDFMVNFESDGCPHIECTKMDLSYTFMSGGCEISLCTPYDNLFWSQNGILPVRNYFFNAVRAIGCKETIYCREMCEWSSQCDTNDTYLDWLAHTKQWILPKFNPEFFISVKNNSKKIDQSEFYSDRLEDDFADLFEKYNEYQLADIGSLDVSV